MKSIKEITVLLIGELISHLDEIKSADPKRAYYNEVLGNTSFLLAALLELSLKKNFSNWDKKKWIDDSLITKSVVQNENLIIEGIMIWGRENTTEQWTDPFSFKIELLKDEMSYKKFTFLFCDLDQQEISYGVFRFNRSYWDGYNRKWKYVIDSNNNL